MTTERPSATMPILLGMALSLLVLFLVVGRADAATACDQCDRDAKTKATNYCATATNPPYMCYYTMYQTYRNKDCTQTNICPGGGTNLPAERDCATEACRELQYPPGTSPCGEGADPGAGTICTNDCTGKFCAVNTAATCTGVPAKAPPQKPSLCYVQCGCKE